MVLILYIASLLGGLMVWAGVTIIATLTGSLEYLTWGIAGLGVGAIVGWVSKEKSTRR